MADPVEQLRAAVGVGDAVALEAALAAGADPDSVVYPGAIPALLDVCHTGNLASVGALLAAGANPNAVGHEFELTPLHAAATSGHTQCIQALLAVGANPTAVNIHEWSPLASAVANGRVEAAAALLEAAPELAVLRTMRGELPLQVALVYGNIPAACWLLKHSRLPPAVEALAVLEATRQQPSAILPLYAPLVARQPLTPAEWARVPTPCHGLNAALPAVLARSEAEAALLVARLPAPDRERLRTAALCIKRTERRRRVSLPAELLRPLLLAAVE